MIDRAVLRRFLLIRSVPGSIVVLTALAAYVSQILAIIQGWPLWAIFLVTLLPWIPLFTLEMVWTYRHYHWLALFYVLVITQGGHFLEHVVQMVQIHVLGLTGAAARGVFGALDIEWVHFTWNTWVLVAVVLLVAGFRTNPWLWATAILAGWHELEHLFIISTYLRTGVVGTAGLLARGGIIAGGLPFTRPDLHFIYNLVETTPLVAGFVYQLMRSYDQWLKRAFPTLPEGVLTDLTNQLQLLRYAPGSTIIQEGDVPDRFYIVTAGEVTILRKQNGHEHELQTLAAGQYFGEIGLLSNVPRTATVRAKTAVEVLSLDRAAFQKLVEGSSATAEKLAEIARQRMPRPGA